MIRKNHAWLLSIAYLTANLSFIAPIVISSSAKKKNRSDNQKKKLEPHLTAKIASSIAKGERRALERNASPRETCTSCQRPPVLCVCEALPKQRIHTSTKVIVLQHPNEHRKKTFSTVPLLSLVLENVQVKVGYQFDPDDLDLESLAQQGRKPLLLFPGPDAISLDSMSQPKPPTPPPPTKTVEPPTDAQSKTADDTLLESAIWDSNDENHVLILMDGTWSEANRMATTSPLLLEACQQVQFSEPSNDCIYDAIRKEPERHCLSTLEACAKALILLEPTTATVAADSLIAALKCLVKTKTRMGQERPLELPRQKGAKAKLYEKNRRRREVERALFQIKKPSLSRTLKNGSILRSLQSVDANAIDNNWEHQSSTSIQTIERRIDLSSACFGIESDGKLCAYILQTEDGALGMLHVEETCRRQGYATALLQEATRVLLESGCGGESNPCTAFIVDGNMASETLFTGQGWLRENPNLKRQSGARRAKRKWILMKS